MGCDALLHKKLYDIAKKYHDRYCKNKFFVLKVLKHDICFMKIATFVIGKLQK